MKNLLNSKFKPATLALLIIAILPNIALAHTGHLANESVHGFLHSEHIIVLTVIAVAAYLFNRIRNK